MEKSNITITSNIYPVKGLLSNDKKFLMHVEGKKALEIVNMQSDYRCERDFTKQQKNDWNDGTKCYDYDEGDYPWGHILKDGQLQEVCRCLNQSCKSFNICRPDFKEEELKHFIDKKYKKNTKDDIQGFVRGKVPAPKLLKDKKNRNKSEIKNDISNDLNLEEDSKDAKSIDEIVNMWDKMHDKDKIRSIKIDNEHFEKKIDNSIIIDSEKTSDEIESTRKRAIKNIVDQKYVIEACENAKLLVNAGPGTGKTFTLIKRLMFLTDKCNLVPANEMLVLCFSKAAIAEIKKRIEQAIESAEANDDLRYLDIRTFDSFATYVITQINEEMDLSDKSYEERIKIATDLIDDNNDIFCDLKHFVVDEIQDLVGVRAKLVQSILKASTCGFTLLGDSCQSIYDYQIEDKEVEMDSIGFYKWLGNYYDNITKVEFQGNYRQTKFLDNMAIKIRTSILSEEEADKKIQKVSETLNKIDSIGKCSSLCQEIVNDSATTCVLCRNNGEVLKVSQYLRNQEVLHSIQKPSTSKLIEPWLGMIFGEYRENTIDYNEFKELFAYFYPNVEVNNINSKWNILKNLDGDDKSRLTIKNVLKNIYMEKSIINNLFISDKSNIVVSTIHRAKGREYEKVILLKDSYERFLSKSEEVNIEEETKTFYVAITRPKKEIKITEFNRKAYLKIVKSNERRWMETGKNNLIKLKYISGFEIGTEKDINKLSFIDLNIFENESNIFGNQYYIRTKIKKGDEVILKKIDVSDSIYTTIYFLYHKNKIIGCMSKNFTYQLIAALKQINNFKHISSLPLEIHECYVDEIVTYISKSIDTEVPKIYEKTHIWNGISIVGLGKLKWKETDL